MTNLFNQTKIENTEKRLPGSAELKAAAVAASNSLKERIESLQNSEDAEQVATINALLEKAPNRHENMFALINYLFDGNVPICEAVAALDTETAKKVLRVHQSQRSHAIKKVPEYSAMTTLFTSTVAEVIYRASRGDKDTTPRGPRATGTPLANIDLSEEGLKQLAKDQGKVHSMIRSIQSRKCSMKKQPDFNESNETYQELLAKEAALKEIRKPLSVILQGTVIPTQDAIRSDLDDILDNVDVDKLKAAESKELLHSIKGLLEQVAN